MSSTEYRRWRTDGWPYCPRCNEDELYSLADPPTVETICGCYRCGPWPITNPSRPIMWETPAWIAEHVREQLPSGVQVSVLLVWDVVEVTLSTRRWRHRRCRKRILVLACMAVADAPAGLPVRVQWR